MQEKKKKETELSSKDVRVSTRPSPVDVTIDRLDVPLCVCARVFRLAVRRERGHSDERGARRRRSFRSVSRFLFLNSSPTSLCCGKPLNFTVYEVKKWESKYLILTFKNNNKNNIFFYLIFCTNIFPLAGRRAHVVPQISVFKTTPILII